MEGVNILTTVVVEELTGWFFVFILVGIALFITGLLCGFEFGFTISNWVMIFLGVICMIACTFPISVSTTTQYKATIEDTVTISDLVKQYDIIKIEDELYTLQLKEEK